MHTFIILAQAAAAQGQQSGFNPANLVPILAIVGIFYFMAIRPQSQRQKQHDALVKSIKTGDKIVTSSGIHGMISNVKETTVIVKIADNVKIELDKSSIGSVAKRDQSEPAVTTPAASAS